MDHERRIAELEDELKQRGARIAELTDERDRQGVLINEMDEHVEDVNAMINRWIEAFSMVQNNRGEWSWGDTIMQMYDALWDRYTELRAKWNKLVPEYNAVVAPKLRNFGRPLGASPAQREDVLRRRRAGESLRRIVDATGLSFQTVRTIIDKKDGVDRATMARLARIAPEKMAEARAQAARKTRNALTVQINSMLRRGADLRKAAKGLGA